MLALSICYHARLQDRNDFECEVVQQFSPPLALTGRVQQFKDEIRWYNYNTNSCPILYHLLFNSISSLNLLSDLYLALPLSQVSGGTVGEHVVGS